MSIVMMIYLASIVSNIKFMLLMFGIVTLGYLLICKAEYSKEEFKARSPKAILTVALLSFFLSATIPNKETIYMMAGASIAKDIAENPKVVDTMDKVYKLVNKELDERLAKKEK